MFLLPFGIIDVSQKTLTFGQDQSVLQSRQLNGVHICSFDKKNLSKVSSIFYRIQRIILNSGKEEIIDETNAYFADLSKTLSAWLEIIGERQEKAYWNEERLSYEIKMN